jgi:hypothetical protein
MPVFFLISTIAQGGKKNNHCAGRTLEKHREKGYYLVEQE